MQVFNFKIHNLFPCEALPNIYNLTIFMPEVIGHSLKPFLMLQEHWFVIPAKAGIQVFKQVRTCPALKILS